MKTFLPLGLRLIIGGLLVFSGAVKVLEPSAEFAAAMSGYQLIPTALLMPIAIAIPWLELCVGTYILFGFYTRLFAGVAAGLFAMFFALLTITKLRGIDPGSCGCFGTAFSMSIGQEIALDAVVLLLCGLLFKLAQSPLRYAVDAWISPKRKKTA